VEVYWAVHEDENNPGKLPKSWRVLYRDADNWKEVNAPSGYPIELDRPSQATFASVTTSGLRLEVQSQEGATAGLFEWGLNGDGRQVSPIHDLQAQESFQLQDNALVWTISLKNMSGAELEIGDLGLPLLFNTQADGDEVKS